MEQKQHRIALDRMMYVWGPDTLQRWCYKQGRLDGWLNMETFYQKKIWLDSLPHPIQRNEFHIIKDKNEDFFLKRL